MDRRKVDILNAIISSYINEPVPVGSRTLSKDYDLGISSATIRNEMADLEDLGYLNKPHQSAGRVPSFKAYRYFVNEYIEEDEEKDYDQRLVDNLKEKISGSSRDFNEIFKMAASILADASKCTAYIVAPRKSDRTIKKLALVKIHEGLFLLIIIGDRGVVERHFISLALDASDEELDQIADMISKKVTGLDFDEISSISLSLKGSSVKFKDLFEEILNRLNNFNRKVSSIDIYYDGLTNIFNFEEYRDLNKAREFMSFIEDRDSLLSILVGKNFTKDLEVIIGDENRAELMKTSSIIRAVFAGENNLYGSLGVIGPARMDYRKLIRTVGIFKRTVEELLEEM